MGGVTQTWFDDVQIASLDLCVARQSFHQRASPSF